MHWRTVPARLRAAATAWLAPFPGAWVNDAVLPSSPGRGSASTTNVRSIHAAYHVRTRGAMGSTIVSLAFRQCSLLAEIISHFCPKGISKSCWCASQYSNMLADRDGWDAGPA